MADPEPGSSLELESSESEDRVEELRRVTTNSNTSSPQLSSCLRSRNQSKQNLVNRSVSFPEDDTQIVTGYLEPANPWEFAESSNKEDVISNYKRSCEKHGTRPIESILEQLEKFHFGTERNECLNLKGECLATASCEALEEILKRVQFVKINLEETTLDDDAAVVMFDMIEYYEAANHLIISSNNEIMTHGWQACSRMLRRTKCLEQLECRHVFLSETATSSICKALRQGSQLQILRLESCNLGGACMLILAALKINTALRELYLAENYLTITDAMQLSALLKSNKTLQLMDISNNNIKDEGFSHLCKGLLEQTDRGLSILVVWNNDLTHVSSEYLSEVLTKNNCLEMLNIGQNELENEFLLKIKDSLSGNRSLLRLGMQSTKITSEGAVAMAEIIGVNPTLQRIDLRDNNIEIAGLLALSLSMKVNRSITQLDLDDKPKNRQCSTEELDKHIELVSELRRICSENERQGEGEQSKEDLNSSSSSLVSRKISLTCDTLMQQRNQSAHCLLGEPRKSGGRLRSPAPSPIPSPVASPSPTRTRFQVSKVSESAMGDQVFFGSSSRFKVTVIEPEGKKEQEPRMESSSSEESPPEMRPPEAKIAEVEPLPQPVSEPQERSPVKVAKENTNSRTRKISAWVAPNLLESKTVEKLLGLFQNPFSKGVSGGNVGGGGEGSGGIPPSANTAPTGGVPSHPGLPDILNNNDGGECQTWPLRVVSLAPGSQPKCPSASAPSLVLLPTSELRARSQSNEGVESKTNIPLAL